MKKAALFAFNGEFMCFVHVLLNALDMQDRGWEVKVVIEGSAVTLIPELARESNPMSTLYRKARSRGIVEGACKACSSKLGVLEVVEKEGIPLLDDMNGHVGMARFMDAGFEVITF